MFVCTTFAQATRQPIGVRPREPAIIIQDHTCTIKTPSSIIRRNRVDIRRAAPPPPTPTHTAPSTRLPRLGHKPVHHHNTQGSEPNMSTDQPKHLTPPSPDTRNSDLDPNTSFVNPNETSTPEEAQRKSSSRTSPATNQDQAQDHQPGVKTRTRLVKPPTRFKDYELK